MATPDIVIKTEPIDEDYSVIKQEELIIKPELDDDSSQHTQVLEGEVLNSFDLLIPKDEPVDDEYLNENSSPPKDDEHKKDSKASSADLMQCEDCKGYFVGVRGLATHRRLRCRNNYICTICGQVFLTNLILQEHLRRHKQKSSPSKETKTTPTTRRSQPKLAKTSTPDPEEVLFACNTCELTFRNGQSLMNHNRIHGGIKHICNQCGKSFKYAVNLRTHKKGDTCVRESIADVLRDNGSDINIKEEAQSEDGEDETLTDQLLVGSTIISKVDSPTNQEVITDAQCNSFEIKKEEIITDDIIPAVLIKKEPVNSEENSNDAQGFDDLILQELIDRKAKSIAKERKAIKRPLPPVEEKYVRQIKIYRQKKKRSLENTDFEEVISSNTLSLEITKPGIDPPTLKTEFLKVEPAFLDESPQVELRHVDDFEVLIISNTLPNYQNKTGVIESLKEEYLKAKKKKLDEVSTDESSQHSSSVATADVAAPSSMFFSVMGNPEPYNEVVRKLDKNYRYTWICPSCPRRYVQRHAFVKHLKSSHFKEKNDIDNVLYELRPELFYPNTSAEDTYCNLCRVTLADAATLRKHRNEFHKEDHTTKMQFKCDKCGKFCSTRSSLVDHVRANCGTEPQYGCAVCGKKFYTKSTLNLHRTMHTGELPHECCYCEKRFRTKGQLTVHTRTHTGERPFPCKVCEKRFTHRETLIAHLSRHIDMKRYKCYGCQQFFSCISGLKTHRLTRLATCGKFKLNARPVGPRVRVIKGNVIFEPQPKINPYYRREADDCDENTKKNGNFQENAQNQENIIDHIKIEPTSVAGES